MLRIVSLNLNGIRSAERKGFLPWLSKHHPDVLCVQELKAQSQDLSLNLLQPEGYQGFFHYAKKKGYSGVGLYTRHNPLKVTTGFGIPEFDDEGRYVCAEFEKTCVVSVYLPSGSSGLERQAAKFRFLKVFYPQLKTLMSCGKQVVVCGDWNIAHKPIDLKNWKANQKNSGFLPEEREWLTQVIDSLRWVDVFRQLDGSEEQYTWWSNRGQAYAKNVGWRLDYQLATPEIAQTARSSAIYKEQRFSDHAPLTIDYDTHL